MVCFYIVHQPDLPPFMFLVHYFSSSQVSSNSWNMTQNKWARLFMVFDLEDVCQQPLSLLPAG